MVDPNAIKAWKGFQHELPWLKESHRALMEVAATIRGRLIAGEDVGIPSLNLLRLCLGQMGATPADQSKIPPMGDGEEDPDDQYFN